MPHNNAFIMNLRIVSIIGNRTILFGVLLFISFFLNDGKQTSIDLYWAGVTIATIPFWEGKTTIKPGPTTFFWLLLLVSAAISTITSWSPAVSITAWMRLLVGFIWYTRYVGVTDSELSIVRSALSFTMMGVALVTVCTLLLPQFGQLFPGSLVFSPAGHAPTAYIAVALLPILYVYALEKKHVAVMGLFAALVTVLISASRGALFLIGIFLISVTLQKKRHLSPTAIVGIRVGAAILMALAIYISIHPINSSAPFSQYLIKDSLMMDPRWSYSNQAIKGMLHAPLFGTGPDTFHLVSKQFATDAQFVAVSAHNAWLQWTTEYGLFGTLIAIVMILHAATRIRKTTTTRISFFIALVGTILLSLMEQNTRHYPILILSTVSLGIYLSHEPRMGRHLLQKLPLIVLVIITVFCGTWILGETMTWKAAPYRKDVVSSHLTSLTTPRDLSFIHYMFGNDPDIAMRLHEYPRAIAADPTNWSWEQTYLGILTSSGDVSNLCTELRRFTGIPSLDCEGNAFRTIIANGQFNDALASLVPDTGKSKFFYMLGYYFLANGDETSASLLWKQARDTSPNWGYYHIEVASLRARHAHDKKAATPILTDCLSNPLARPGCQYFLEHPSLLPPPGSLRPHIESIPVIIEVP